MRVNDSTRKGAITSLCSSPISHAKLNIGQFELTVSIQAHGSVDR